MSIILEALRKSERERRLGQIPTLEGGAPLPESSRGTARRAAAFTLAVLLAGGAYWGWMHSRPESGKGVDTAPAAPAGEARPSLPPAGFAGNALPVPAVPQAGDNPSTVAHASLPSVPERSAPLTLNVLSWSENPKRRFAMIDQVIVREGQQLPGGYLLREITHEGVVLEHQGRRFTLRP